jgi:predicted nucleotidyltransferase/DNA-binding XRE family transcriptional regulator
MSSAAILRQARKAAGLSQTELARRVRVPQSVVSEYEGGKREPSVPMLARLVAGTGHELTLGLQRVDDSVRGLPDSRLGRLLRRRRRAVMAAVQRAGGANVRVFGSAARGDDRPDSDIDLLVDLPPHASLLDMLTLEDELARILQVEVDLATVAGLKPRVRATALREAIPL